MNVLRPPLLCLALALLVGACGRRSPSSSSVADDAKTRVASVPKTGPEIYLQICAECHGPQGEGVADKYDEPLFGNKSLEALTRLIDRTMPDGKPEVLDGEGSRAVAAYIYDAFYSPEARARNHPPIIEPARLTNRQFQESVADLFGSFRPVKQALKTGGLQAEYHQSKGMNKKEKRVLERVDPVVDFQFGNESPVEGITADQFSIAWQGSLSAAESGAYEFRLRTPNGARLYLNTELAAGDANRRDDSDARRQPATIDLWVSSGGISREGVAQVFLPGGRTYPLRLDYFKFKETNAAVSFEWKPPHGHWAIVPSSVLSPESSTTILVAGTTFPADDSSQGYERGTSVSKAWDEAVTRAAVGVANQVEGRIGPLAGIPEKATNRVEQLKDFCGRLAERAFRRPLSEDARRAWVDRFFVTGVAPETAMKRAVLLLLKSPEFLYPQIDGVPDDHAVAARLALALWDSLPDEALRSAAAAGWLREPEQIRAQADRMLQDPRARAKLRQFFDHWLVMDEADDISKDAKAFPDFDDALLADLRESLELFVDREVWNEASDYRQLLLADYMFLNPRLAKFYGAEPPAKDEFVPVKFEADRRAGVLTHPFLLTTLAYHKSSSPIHRGVFLTRNILGRFLKPPPMAIEFMDDRFDPSLTMREKVTELTAKDACRSCHATINPLGFSLEHFDAVGRFRSRDNQKPVDASADYVTEEGAVVKLENPRDLARHAAESPEARRGFVRHLFLHTIKQAPAAYGPRIIEGLDARFVANEHHVRKLLLEIAMTAALHQLPTTLSPSAATPGGAAASRSNALDRPLPPGVPE